MNTYEAGSPASAAADLIRRLTALTPGGRAVEIDLDTFLRATRLGLDPHSEAAILDAIPVVPADHPAVVAAHDQPTAQPTLKRRRPATPSATTPIGPAPNRSPSSQPSASTGRRNPWRTPGCACSSSFARRSAGRSLRAADPPANSTASSTSRACSAPSTATCWNSP